MQRFGHSSKQEGQGAQRALPIPAIIAIFAIGFLIFSYPFVSSWLYEQSALQVKTEYHEAEKEYTDDQLMLMRAAVQEYNEALVNAGVILLEPFDPDRYDVDAMYMKLPTDNPIMGYVNVPSLDLTLPVYHTTLEDALDKGAGHLAHTSLPIGGPSTHSAISAHSGLPTAEMFTHLNKLQRGNIFTIEILGDTLAYEVDYIETVLPDQVESLAIQPGQDLCTLITCTPIGINTHRLLVHGKRTTVPIDQIEEPSIEWSISYTDVVSALAGIVIALFAASLIYVAVKRRREDKVQMDQRYANYMAQRDAAGMPRDAESLEARVPKVFDNQGQPRRR